MDGIIRHKILFLASPIAYSTIVMVPGTSAAQLAREIVKKLKAAGFRAYLVGGCVRDLLLERTPVDYDVATSARPEQIQRLFPDALPVGKHFGVLLVRRGGDEVEVATFRSEHGYRDGRHPDNVSFETDPARDAARRDFTINALLFDPETGEVLDYTGGQADLKARLLRAIGDPEARFREDRLRMLRAVRLASTLGFEIDPQTLEAVRRYANRIHEVSPERRRDELVRLLTGGGARRGVELLDQSGLLVEELPEVSAMKGVAQPPEFHPEGDVWTHTLLMLELMQQPTATLAFGVLLHDVGKPKTFRLEDRIRFNDHAAVGARMAADIMRRLRFSNDEIRTVSALVAEHLRFKDVQKMRESTLRRFLRAPYFEELLELHRLDCLASHGWLDNYEFVRRKQLELPPEQLRPLRLITGDDLIAAGYTPGPDFRKMLDAVEDAQLEGAVNSREQALDLIRHRFGPPRQ